MGHGNAAIFQPRATTRHETGDDSRAPSKNPNRHRPSADQSSAAAALTAEFSQSKDQSQRARQNNQKHLRPSQHASFQPSKVQSLPGEAEFDLRSGRASLPTP